VDEKDLRRPTTLTSSYGSEKHSPPDRLWGGLAMQPILVGQFHLVGQRLRFIKDNHLPQERGKET